MSEIGKLVDRTIALGLAELMKANGYRKAARNWHRASGDDWLLANVQSSVWNRASEGRFTVNLGVYSARVEELAGGPAPTRKPVMAGSTVQDRAGSLAYGRDHWWTIGPVTDLDALSEDVVRTMREHGLPWLRSHAELPAISRALARQPSRQAVAAALLSGDAEEATARFRKAVADRPAGSERLRSWTKDVGLAT